MKLSPTAIQAFKKIYHEKRGIDLSDGQADIIGWKLLELANKTLSKKENKPP